MLLVLLVVVRLLVLPPLSPPRLLLVLLLRLRSLLLLLLLLPLLQLISQRLLLLLLLLHTVGVAVAAAVLSLLLPSLPCCRHLPLKQWYSAARLYVWGAAGLAVLGLVTVTAAFSALQQPRRLLAVGGLALNLLLAYLCSTNRRAIQWKPVAWGLLLQVAVPPSPGPHCIPSGRPVRRT